METSTDFPEPITSALSHNNASFWRAEDSGYHTLTPGSIACSEISNENIEPSLIQGQLRISGQFQVNYDITPESSYCAVRRYVRSKNVLASTQSEGSNLSPVIRKGIKRSYTEDDEITPNSIPTPTSMIAGDMQKLKFTECFRSGKTSFSSSSEASKYPELAPSDLYHLSEHVLALSYPTTPIKKVCRTSCKLSPMRKSNKKLNFAIHSLSCESRGVVKKCQRHKVVRNIQFRPDQKVDLIKMLYQNTCVLPPLMKIVSYLSNDDISRFKTVSPVWNEVWNHVSKTKKEEFKIFLRNEKDNQENKKQDQSRKSSDEQQCRSLKEVHNVMNTNLVSSSPRSPPGTPRTIKFRKFAKCAQQDNRLQLSCVRCYQPAKVTSEASGEEWAECTSASCSYNFCKFCKCDRHPGKSCFKYDLDGPSPSKRKRNTNTMCTKKSKKNLYRLMI